MADATTQGGITRIETGSVTDAVLSPDGQHLYVARAGTIYDYDDRSGALLNQWRLGTKLQGIDVSPDSRSLVATELAPGASTGNGNGFGQNTDWSVYRLDLTTGVARTYTNTVNSYNGSNYHDAAYLSDGTILLTQNYSGSGFTPLTTLNPSTGTFTASQSSYAQNGALTSNRDHSKVMFSPSNISDQPTLIYPDISGGSRDRRVPWRVSGRDHGLQQRCSGFRTGRQLCR